MSRRSRIFIIVGVLVSVAILGAYAFVRGHGFNARAQPGRFETIVARGTRGLAIPGSARNRSNPVPWSEEVVREGLAHFADHCAMCHGNDGSGDTEMGKGLYPKAPDMRLPATQQLTDGELFYLIENGVPLTGMPGWGTGTQDGELASWHLVHFIRRLPELTSEELEHMAVLNPISADAWLQRMEEQESLSGGSPGAKPAAPKQPAHKHSGGH
jgi:mono/diheme cytochrome c family protein